MTGYDFDLFVIGAGSGGVRAARIAAGFGAKVAIAESYRLGGTCVIRGCVPKKLLVLASRFRDDFEDARAFGWDAEVPRHDWARLIAAKDREIDRLEGVYGGLLERSGVTLFRARASFQNPHTIALDGGPDHGRRVCAKRILIATGASPVFDSSIKGIKHAITSNEAFHLAALPDHVVIAGGGYIAVEFAGIFRGLGSDVTILYRGDKILRGFDEDLRDGLTAALVARGIKVMTGRTIASIEARGVGRATAGKPLALTLDDGGVLAADTVLLAIGRNPNVEGLGLERVGVTQGRNGRIVVDAHGQTSLPHVFAVGDVTDQLNLTPVAIRQGHAVADSLYGEAPWIADLADVPSAVFSTPEIGSVGLAEHAAREAYPSLDVYKARFRPMRATLAGRDEKMLMKLLVDGSSGRVVGCHVLGPDAAEIVQMAAIAIRLRATKTDFDRTMALHPTVAEELVTMREAWVAGT